MSVSSIYNTNNMLFNSYSTSKAPVSRARDLLLSEPAAAKEDQYTKSQEVSKEPATYNANGALASVNPRHGGSYRSLLIMSYDPAGAYIPGGPNDDKEMVLNFGLTTINGDGQNHPYQQDYDEYNAIFEEIYKDVLSERGFMPESGDLNEVTIKVGEIHKVYDEVMARVKSDQRASELASSLGIEYAEVKTDAELRASF